ncbi:hypothetical protein BDW74DRAFT_175598 [Aspergillus multicolor]|uniref:uncharacterized protein n=1 Tax=Aspergillus multicolor TaxID=41759 RepID=UPI003CCD5A27
MLLPPTCPALTLGLGLGLSLLTSTLAQTTGTPLPSIGDAYVGISSGECLAANASLVTPTDDRSNCVTVSTLADGNIGTGDVDKGTEQYLVVDEGTDPSTVSFSAIPPGLTLYYDEQSSGEGYYLGLFLGTDNGGDIEATYGPDWEVVADGTAVAPVDEGEEVEDPVRLVLVTV